MENVTDEQMEASNLLISEAISKAGTLIVQRKEISLIRSALGYAQVIFQQHRDKINQFQCEGHLESLRQLINIAAIGQQDAETVPDAGSVIQSPKRKSPPFPVPNPTLEQCKQAYLALQKVPLAQIERSLANLITELRTSLGMIIAKMSRGESFAPPPAPRVNRDEDEEFGNEYRDEEDDD